MNEPLSISAVRKLILETKESFDYNTIFWKLKAYRVKNLLPPTVELVRLCLALHKLGLPINTNILRIASTEQPIKIIGKLHRLGDLHILVLKRVSTKKEKRTILQSYIRLTWILNPLFLKVIET